MFALRQLSKKAIEYDNDLNLEPEGTQNPPRHSLQTSSWSKASHDTSSIGESISKLYISE